MAGKSLGEHATKEIEAQSSRECVPANFEQGTGAVMMRHCAAHSHSQDWRCVDHPNRQRMTEWLQLTEAGSEAGVCRGWHGCVSSQCNCTSAHI